MWFWYKHSTPGHIDGFDISIP